MHSVHVDFESAAKRATASPAITCIPPLPALHRSLAARPIEGALTPPLVQFEGRRDLSAVVASDALRMNHTDSTDLIKLFGANAVYTAQIDDRSEGAQADPELAA